MNRHHRRWLSLMLGIIAGYAALGLLLSDGLDKRETLGLIAALTACLGGLTSLSALGRSGCHRQTGRR
jgi:hypothetical protein